MISDAAIAYIKRVHARQRERGRDAFKRMSLEKRAERREAARLNYHRRKAGLTRPKASLSWEQRALNKAAADKACRVRNRKVIDQYRRENPCVDCGYADIRALQFDHRDRQAKTMNVSAMAKRGTSVEKLMAEIAKCDIRCANCHMIRSAEEGHFLPRCKEAD